MIYGYLRVSSDEQDVNSQKQGVDEFAQNKGWVIDKYITDEGVSGGKDPDKRNLGPLLKLLQKDDVIICSEISRLGRDLYMVMDILHFAMNVGCVIYTVKDKFVLGDDIQSKVLAFAFGLSAEIERQMIRQRTKEGLRLKVKQGILLGRPIGKQSVESSTDLSDKKDEVIQQFNWGVPERRLAQNFNCDRNTITRWLHRWGVKHSAFIEKQEKARKELESIYRKEKYSVVEDIDRDKMKILIEQDMTIPQIADVFSNYSYEQIYDTILCDEEFNPLYRQHAQKKLTKR